MNRLTQSLDAALIYLTGNRVYTAGLAGVVQHPLIMSSIDNELAQSVSMGVFFLGMSVIAATRFGHSTTKHYLRTKKHIRDTGGLDPAFVKNIIQKSENEAYIGYCQQQGCYLAAKRAGQEKVFREVASQYSRVRIPFV